MKPGPQAKDVPEAEVLRLVAAKVTTLWGLQKALSELPPKVVQAKLRAMVARKVLHGCACGCSGGFSIRQPRT